MPAAPTAVAENTGWSGVTADVDARWSGLRVGLVYVIAWLPYLAVFIVTYRQIERASPALAAFAAALNIAPEVVLGAGVLYLTWRVLWNLEPRRWLLALHAVLAAIYSVSTVIAKLALSSLLGAGGFSLAELDPGLVAWQLLVGVLLYAVIVSVTSALLGTARARRERARAAEAEALRARAELEALRGSLNPHFLFNTLHGLLALVRRDPTAAEEGLERLGDMLRYTLGLDKSGVDEVPLAREWAFVTSYLALERLRLGARLEVELDVDDAALDVYVPGFSIQPLVENAIRHGIASRAAGGALSVRARRTAGELIVEVTDDGPGAPGGTRGGLGLGLLRRRLRALYGPRGALRVIDDRDVGFAVELRVPARADVDAEVVA